MTTSPLESNLAWTIAWEPEDRAFTGRTALQEQKNRGVENKLVIAPGMLTGSAAAISGRISVGCKSPLTGGIKESNVGGSAPHALGKTGIAAIVVEGQAPGGKYWVLRIDAKGHASLEPADEFVGFRTYACAEKMLARYGEKNGILLVGPAGEQRLASASIQSTDVDKRPCRAAGRGGLGAVMASKGLKAVIVDRGAGNFGGDRGPKTDKILPPQGKAPDFRMAYRTSKDQAALYRLSGDKNPLHIDPGFAEKGGFDKPILHGLCSFGYAGRAILNTACNGNPDRLKSFSVRFMNVAYPGDTLITQGWQLDAHQYVIQTTNQDGKIILGNSFAEIG